MCIDFAILQRRLQLYAPSPAPTPVLRCSIASTDSNSTLHRPRRIHWTKFASHYFDFLDRHLYWMPSLHRLHFPFLSPVPSSPPPATTPLPSILSILATLRVYATTSSAQSWLDLVIVAAWRLRSKEGEGCGTHPPGAFMFIGTFEDSLKIPEEKREVLPQRTVKLIADANFSDPLCFLQGLPACKQHVFGHLSANWRICNVFSMVQCGIRS